MKLFVYFNIILQNYLVNFIIIFPFTISIVYSWYFFLKINMCYIRLNPSNNDVLLTSNVIKKYDSRLFIQFSLVLIFFLTVVFFALKGCVQSVWLNHNYISNFNSNLIFLILLTTTVSYYIFAKSKSCNIIINNDYYFSLINACIFICYMFTCNSLFSFLFVLEVVSIIIFYKFVVSKFWFSERFSFFKKTNIMERVFSRNYINVLFFQYWVNFFSSVVLIIVIINLIYVYGSTDWFFLNFLNLLNNNIFIYNDFEFNILMWVSFFICFFLKVGLTPAHLFKIEIYKGIPFVSIFFYTTFYFLGYFIFLTVLVQTYINSYKIYFYFFFICFVIVGFVYVLFLLFDVSFTKAFFAYSTIVNSIAFIIFLLANM